MIPIIGEKYGQWTIISQQLKKGSNRHIYWHVKCKCGKETFRSATTLINNRTKSCKSCSKSNNFNTFAISYFNKIKARANKLNLEFNLTIEFLWLLYEDQNRKCALSNLPIEFKTGWRTNDPQSCSLDRVDNFGGYTVDNVQWVHKDINLMKHTFKQEYFIELCKNITTKCG